jgi:mycofactocin system FadH/OYE family oxidoreductase 2
VSANFKYLFTPLDINGARVRNRTMQTSHAKMFEDRIENGALPSERNAYYHAERAKGGAGLLVMEYQMVHVTSTGGLFNLSNAWRPEVVPRYRMIADMVHDHGGTIFCQLCHNGIHAQGDQIDDYHVSLAPSQIWGLSIDTFAAKEMEKEDIEEVIEGFRISARHAKEGGLDGIELHGAHSYLLAQFWSPLTNKRKDEYGGSLENRMRFSREVIEAVRNEVGDRYPLGIRISADEFTQGGLSPDDMIEIAKRLEEWNLLDFLSVSQGSYWTMESACAIAPNQNFPPGGFLPYVAAIKEAVNDVLVFCVGRINDPMLAEKVLADGQADMVGMTRAMICDPEMPNKAREGRLDDIRHCVACNQGCIGRITQGLAITCVQNPGTGREKRLGSGTLVEAPVKKDVAVIGGGIAGLKAAEIAARRGHRVVVYEKESEPGGQIRLAGKTPIRSELAEMARYLRIQNHKLGVTIKLGVEATADRIISENHDAVVVATGALPIDTSIYARLNAHVEIPGVDQENVVSLWDVLEERVEVGESVVVVDGEAHYRTLAVAEYLVEQGKKVQMITHFSSPTLFLTYHVDRMYYARRVSERRIKVISMTEVKEISGNAVHTVHAWAPEREKAIEGVDTIVWAAGVKSNDGLYRELKGKVKEVYRIGDCVAPRPMEHAFFEGEQIGRKL